jgi:hypothetical protein
MKTVDQDATLRHDSRSVAREASAAPAASFKRIIKGRPFEVGFDRSHQSQQQGAPL